jgi:predicted transcriptional regulator
MHNVSIFITPIYTPKSTQLINPQIHPFTPIQSLSAGVFQRVERIDEQVGEQVGEQVKMILKACSETPRTKTELLQILGLANAYMNYKRHLLPLVALGIIAMTIPDKPNSRLQKYRLTEKGKNMLKAAK